MKKLFWTVFVLTTYTTSYAQIEPLPKVDGEYGYSEIVTVDSMNKESLYSNAKVFLANAFKSSKDVIQYEDKEAGKIIGKGNLSVIGNQNKVMGQSWERKITAYFSFEISCKDNKYRYRIYDITFKSFDQHTSRQYAPVETIQTIETLIEQCDKGTYKKSTSEAYPKLAENFKTLIDQLKKDMPKKSDW